MNIASIYSVFNLRTGDFVVAERIFATGQAAAEKVKSLHSKRSHFYVLEGFEFNGNFVPLEIYKN